MANVALAAAGDPERARSTMTRDIPMRRLAQPEEVTDATIFLLSPEARFATGAEFVVDGGLTAR